jgi:hypothetical protein
MGNEWVSGVDPDGRFVTWSINKGGLSIGFNLTPIGIPLGAGINVGWNSGLSLGGYGEVGYRVGGTGFGSGATVSKSFDYNFKQRSWTSTISEGVYASIGLLNVGASLNQTYDYKSRSWSNGWGVNTGIGFGNDEFGMGLSVGYGSSGWNFGLGGYYNSRAWESNPAYEPDKWNDNGAIQYNNNCYSYALDDANNPIGGKPQPGDYSGNVFSNFSVDGISRAAIADGRIKQPNFWNKLGFGKRGYYEVYLVIDNVDGIQDYHWYRQDRGGLWSHKPGNTYATNVDATGRVIRNPLNANRNYGPFYNGMGTLIGSLNYNNGGIKLWVRK